jgi:hypothetical protein
VPGFSKIMMAIEVGVSVAKAQHLWTIIVRP